MRSIKFKEQLWKYLGILVTIIGVVTAIASLSGLSQTIALTSLGLIVIPGIVIDISHFRFKDNKTTQHIPGVIGQNILSMRAVLDIGELYEIAKLDKEEYGDLAVDEQGLYDWWKRYPKGIYALFHDRRVVGAIGIWPLTKNAYQRLTDGKIMESQLLKSDISIKKSEQAYWYFGDIILQKKYRTKRTKFYFPSEQLAKVDESLAGYFLHHALEVWFTEANLASVINVCAIGASDSGISLLERFVFRPTGKKTPGKEPVPIYTRTSTRQEFQEDIEKSWGLKMLQQIPDNQP